MATFLLLVMVNLAPPNIPILAPHSEHKSLEALRGGRAPTGAASNGMRGVALGAGVTALPTN
jgi:hypothetical protein